MQTCTQNLICLCRPIWVASTWLRHLCARWCMAEQSAENICTVHCVWLCLDALVFTRKVKLAKPAVRWDMARWWLAFGCLCGDQADDVVYEVYWSDLHSSQGPRPCLAVSLPASVPLFWIYVNLPAFNTGLHSQHTHSISHEMHLHPACSRTHPAGQWGSLILHPSNWSAKVLSSHLLRSNLSLFLFYLLHRHRPVDVIKIYKSLRSYCFQLAKTSHHTDALVLDARSCAGGICVFCLQHAPRLLAGPLVNWLKEGYYN